MDFNVEEFSHQLDEFAYDFDYYEYMDNEMSFDQTYCHLVYDPEGLQNWLQEIVEDDEDNLEAKLLLDKMNTYLATIYQSFNFVARGCNEFRFELVNI